jgi:hypothetical protein
MMAGTADTVGVGGVRKRRRFHGGTWAQQFSHMIDRLAWAALPIEEFLVWRKATPRHRRRRRAEIWARFAQLREHPQTRSALIEKLRIVFTDAEIASLLARRLGLGSLDCALPPALRPPPRPCWGGPWNKTPWRRPSPLAWAIAGVGLPALAPSPTSLAAILSVSPSCRMTK